MAQLTNQQTIKHPKPTYSSETNYPNKTKPMAQLTNQQTIKHPTANKPIKTSTQMTKHAN